MILEFQVMCASPKASTKDEYAKTLYYQSWTQHLMQLWAVTENAFFVFK